MQWSSSPPADPGWFWYRSPEDFAKPVEVALGRNGGLIVWLTSDQDWELPELLRLCPGTEWAGPIPEPSVGQTG